MTPAPANATPGRRGFSYRGLMIALVLVLGVPAIAWSLRPGSLSGPEAGSAMMHTVERGDFVHEIVDRGTVESANNTEVKCEVKSKNLAGTQMLWVIPEGTLVTQGDTLVELDKSALENDLNTQLITFHKSEAEVIQARAALDVALIALEEYIPWMLQRMRVTASGTALACGACADCSGGIAPLLAAASAFDWAARSASDEGGTFQQQRLLIENEIAVADENRNRADEYYTYSLRLFRKGFLNELQLKADEFAVQKAKNDFEMATTKLDVLQKYTKAKELRRLQCDIDSAQAKLRAAEASHKVNVDLVKLSETQIANCTIAAPCAGQVVYATVTGYRGTKEVMIAAGEMARERQVLIRLPDPTRMQVLARISEAKIAMVAKGMTARIRLDAFPDLELEGTVTRVDEFPAPSFFGSIVKEYETAVMIHETPPGLRPGLTAETRILIECVPDRLMVPVQSLFEHGGEFYCVVPDGRQWRAVKVQNGSTNDKHVVIREGIEEGRQIVLNAAAYREKAVGLPELAEGGRGGSRGKQRSRNGPRKLEEQGLAGNGLQPADIAKRLLQQYDKDGDGRLDVGELPENWRARLKASDANGDGKLDAAELTRAAGPAPQRPPPEAARGSSSP